MKKIPLLLFIMAQSTINTADYQEALRSPINFTPDGIQSFFKEQFNHQAYTQLLSTDLAHFRQFINFGVDTKQGPDYIKHVLRIFRQGCMSCEFMCAQEVAATINFLTSTLPQFHIEKQREETVVLHIKNVCYEEFHNNFELFKENPDKFLSTLAEKIHDTTKLYQAERETRPSEVRNLVVLFLDTLIGKLLWTPSDNQGVWHEFCIVGNSLWNLAQEKIICKEEDLNDLVKLLIQRFSYFLSLAGTELKETFFATARNDLMVKKFPWLDIDELEAEMTKKEDMLRNALMQAQIRSKAKHEYGLGE